MSSSNLDKSTFITSLRAGDGGAEGGSGGGGGEGAGEPGGAADSRKALLASVSGMDRVQDLHGQLSGVVGALSTKVAGVLKKQETEFLSAYRAHMYNVQRELQELRTKVKNAELQLQRDAKIKELTQERDWFRKEALRLDSYATSIKKEMQFMEDKLSSVEEDRAWLEKQLKNAKKQNKLLRSELELHLEGIVVGEATPPGTRAAALSLAPPIRDASPRKEREEEDRMRSCASHEALPTPTPTFDDAQQLQVQRQRQGSGRSKSSAGFYNAPELDGDGAGASGEDAQAKRLVRQLREQLSRERDQVKALRAGMVSERTDRADLEEFFLKCVEEVKKDVARRRNRAKLAGSKTRPREKEGAAAADANADADVEERDMRKLRLQDLAAADRRKVMEHMMQSDDVFDVLYGALFSRESPGGGAAGLLSVLDAPSREKSGSPGCPANTKKGASKPPKREARQRSNNDHKDISCAGSTIQDLLEALP